VIGLADVAPPPFSPGSDELAWTLRAAGLVLIAAAVVLVVRVLRRPPAD